MPVHPHFRDLAVLRLAEHRPPRIYPLPGSAAAIEAAELGREPGAGDVDLAGLEADLGLVYGNVLPVSPDRVDPDGFFAEGSLEENGVGREHRHQFVHVPALPPPAKRVYHLAVGLVHGAQYTPIRNPESRRMVDGSTKAASTSTGLDRDPTCQGGRTAMKRIL